MQNNSAKAQELERSLIIEIIRVTEKAAIAAARYAVAWMISQQIKQQSMQCMQNCVI